MSEYEDGKVVPAAARAKPAPAKAPSWVRFAARHEKLLSGIGIVWFWLGVAVNAGFVELPRILLLTDRAAMIAAVAFNVGWWGFVRPYIERMQARGPLAKER